MAKAKASVSASDGELNVPGIALREEPHVYLASINGPWLLKHSTTSWRADDPQKGFQRIVREQRAKEIARTVLDTERTFPNAITLATKTKLFKLEGCHLHLPNSAKFL